MNKEVISTIKILPLIEEKFNVKNVKGYEYFTSPYASVCCIAATKSGKTTVVFRTLEQRLVKGMKVVIFCPSHAHDHTYKLMKDMIRQKECEVYCHESFVENGQNLITRYLNEDKQKQKEEKRTIPPIKTDENRKEFGKSKLEKIRKTDKYLHAKTVFIFDDLAGEMAHPFVTNYLARSRHWKTSVYINIHDVKQLKPAAIRQITDVILFPNLSDERVQTVAERMGLIFKSDTNQRCFLQDLYDDATIEPYNFLTCNRPERVFRHNFDQQYIIDEKQLGKKSKSKLNGNGKPTDNGNKNDNGSKDGETKSAK